MPDAPRNWPVPEDKWQEHIDYYSKFPLKEHDSSKRSSWVKNLLQEQKDDDYQIRNPFAPRKKMPVHPAEEHAGGDITDQVAKDSKDSTASSHEHHQGDSGATSGGSLGAMAHKAHPGPVMAENIGEPASKEELKKRAEELNK